jgi:hypothetical protein
MVRREQLRLKRMFQQLLLASLVGPGALEACSAASSSGGSSTPDGGQTDGTAMNGDGTSRGDSGPSGDTGPAGDSGTTGDSAVGPEGASCVPSAPHWNDASIAEFPPDSGMYAPCYYFVDFPCGVANSGTSGCYLYLKDCASICTLEGGFIDCLYWYGSGCEDGSVTAVEGGPATIACGVCNGVGRRPAGLRRGSRRRGADALGGYFADAARLEAASVVAFDRLRDELARLDAPQELVRVAARSSRDEVRHARVTGRLARRFGAEPGPVRVPRARRRSLEAVAIENAVEGCVRETFGAMLATWQARHATEPSVRAAMKRIAVDETRHAALAWAIDAWACRQLDEPSRRRLDRSRRAAVRKLLRDLGDEMPAAARRSAGLPSAREARAMASAMFEAHA